MAQCSIFRGQFSYQAGCRITGAAQEDLMQLVNRSLLQNSEQRYLTILRNTPPICGAEAGERCPIVGIDTAQPLRFLHRPLVQLVARARERTHCRQAAARTG